jgi:hypothetical protein
MLCINLLFKLIFVFIGVCAVFLYTRIFVDIYHTYGSPNIPFSKSKAYNVSLQLVDCIQRKDREEHWDKIKTCLQNAHVYSVRNGSIPYMWRRSLPVAWVQPKISSTSVFLTSLYINKNVFYQALVMVHECSHLSLGTKDIAYVFEKEFLKLSYEQHLKNADSYLYRIYKYCINDGTSS